MDSDYGGRVAGRGTQRSTAFLRDALSSLDQDQGIKACYLLGEVQIQRAAYGFKHQLCLPNRKSALQRKKWSTALACRPLCPLLPAFLACSQPCPVVVQHRSVPVEGELSGAGCFRGQSGPSRLARSDCCGCLRDRLALPTTNRLDLFNGIEIESPEEITPPAAPHSRRAARKWHMLAADPWPFGWSR